MSSVFPAQLDQFTDVPAGTNLDGSSVAAPTVINPDLDHVTQTNLQNDALVALEAKLGIDGSAVHATIDWRIGNAESNISSLTSGKSNVGHTHTHADITDFTTAVSSLIPV